MRSPPQNGGRMGGGGELVVWGYFLIRLRVALFEWLWLDGLVGWLSLGGFGWVALVNKFG